MPNPDFALQWLDFLGIKIYNKEKQILEYDGRNPNYELSPLSTSIKSGEKLGDEDEENKFIKMTFPELDRKGYAIKADSSKTWKSHQRVSYVVIRKTENTIGMSYVAFRKAVIEIEHDAARRRFRIKGDNVYSDERLREDSGIGPWIVYDEDAPLKIKRRKKVKYNPDEARSILRGLNKGRKGLNAEIIKIENEVPLMVSDEKYIVCLKKTNVPPRILVTGQPRQGKSLFTNGTSNRMFYLWEERIGWVIDPQDQFYNLSLPTDVNNFMKRISWIGEKPKPIPAIQFYLACKNEKEFSNPNISLKLTLSFHEFLNKFGFYSNGTPDWKLLNSQRYLRSTIKYIKNASDISELRDGLYKAIPQANDEKKGEGMRSMIFKWVNTFETILHERFTSNLYKGDDLATDELNVLFPDGSELSGHPFIMAMEAGIIPIINTSMVPDKMWVRNYLADLMQKIIKHQKSMRAKGMRKRLIIIADEMQAIYEEGARVKDNCSKASEALFRQGGFQGIGYIGNTQSLEKLNKEMIKHATHIVCFFTQCPKERKMIKDMFDLDKEDVNQLLQLKEQEFMIFSKVPFVIYDRWGRKKEDNRTWFKGKLIPPFNYHIPPE